MSEDIPQQNAIPQSGSEVPATVERHAEFLRAIATSYAVVHRNNRARDLNSTADLLEQQARTIAELRAEERRLLDLYHRKALTELHNMYVNTWDKADGGLMMMSKDGIDQFERAHAKARTVERDDLVELIEDYKGAGDTHPGIVHKRRYDKLMVGVDTLYATIEQQARTIAEQAARLAECERDAGRYRWLKENHLQLGPDCWIRTGDDLDDATDADIDGAKT